MGLFRIQPNLAPGAYQTYAYARKRDTVIKSACEQVGCENFRKGWMMVVDERTPLGMAQAHYIRTQSGRTFRDGKVSTGETVFVFESGQRCFADHATIPEAFWVRGGDWRADKGLIRRHKNGLDWAEDFGEHQQRIAAEQERG